MVPELVFGEKVKETDVLVVGSGITDARAALEANDQGVNVTLVTRAIEAMTIMDQGKEESKK